MKTVYALTAFLSLNLNAATFQPEFGSIQDEGLAPLFQFLDADSNNDSDPWEWQTIQSVRVKIFPHNGVYSAPQGKEKVQNSVLLRSNGPCVVVNTEGRSLQIAQLNQTLSTQKLGSQKMTFDCESPIQVVREKGMNSYQYGGRIEAKRSGAVLELVNEVAFEEYLKGVVPAEMPPSWHIEALKAQAVAARTYAAFQILQSRRGGAKDFDVDDTIQYQAYLGRSWQRPSTDFAVDETAGMIMTYQLRPIVSYFSADSGGYTEHARNIWGERFDVPYTPSKPEVYDPAAFKTDWTKQMTLSEISAGFVERLKFPAQTSIQSIQVNERSASGRAVWVEVKLRNEKAPRLIWGEDFRRAARLRSTLFEINISDSGNKNAVIFTGKGFGHGVGMNQTGAHVLARDMGWGFSEILNFYYDQIEFTR